MMIFFVKGTGKTKTIVAAIQEIINANNEKCVLVCAQSNTACDEIADRLLSVLNTNQILRLYAKSVSIETISEKIRLICNIQNGKLKMPGLEYIYQFRVVICTLLMAGQIAQARQQYNNFQPNHFSHIIIDEAASCQQTVSLCAIAGKN